MEQSNAVLDLMLKSLFDSTAYKSNAAGNSDQSWATLISNLVPGTTAKQCQKRFEELRKELMKNNKGELLHDDKLDQMWIQPDLDPQRGATKSTAKKSGGTIAKKLEDKDIVKNTAASMPSGDHGPIMVIHVCDEAKKLKRDFTCPRDLLVNEMKYFAEYLSTDSQRMEEVDISVHCDVQIFDWLLKYVKRTIRDAQAPPSLEPANVISILISSDFLKMDDLVQECIEFCHCNMAAIVATPCNMNCIDERLVTRMAELFNHNELEDVKDKKDKFKSKLFAKKVESLFGLQRSAVSSSENASTLYRCSACKKILTRNWDRKVKCLQSRMRIDRHGNFSYCHQVDTSFDVSDFVLDIKNQKSWRDVYWQLWGIINCLHCSRCGEIFQGCELASCRYHPEEIVYIEGARGSGGGGASEFSAIGEYTCCRARVARFEPVTSDKGCRTRDHIVNMQPMTSGGRGTVSSSLDSQQVYNDLIAHREAVCQPYQRVPGQKPDNTDVDVFAMDEMVCGLRGEDPTSSSNFSKHNSRIVSQPLLRPIQGDREAAFDDKFFAESDDEVGDDEEVPVSKQKSSKSALVTPAILLNAADFNTTKQGKWDSSRSMRYNQDSQREEDQRRMREMVHYLIGLRPTSDKIDRLKPKEYAGGMFSKLEAQWRSVNIPPPRLVNPAFRARPRLSALPMK